MPGTTGETEMQNTNTARPPMSPSKILALGFFAIIFTGALLLLLPFAAEPGVRITPLQALFTSTSAVCVTGLTVVDTASSYSLFGELVILSLIQLGGLGFMLFATSVLILSGRRISLRNRILLHETMSMPGLSGTVRTTIRFMLIVIAVELAGSVLLAIRFVPMFGFWKGTYFGFFHAISAFCNAGFDLFGAAGSLTQFQDDPHVLMTISSLIIVGGIGFAVLADLMHTRFRARKLHLHSKIVLATTAALLLAGSLLFALIEWDNPATLAAPGADAPQKILNAWFQSVTTRTAGYFSVQQSGLRNASKLLSSFLMFIGASPASTGGGIKTSTFFVLIVLIRSVMRGKEDVEAFRRRVPASLIRTALSIFFISLSLLAAGSVGMSLLEQSRGFSTIDLLFEEASALGTVGLTSAGTANMTHPTQVWLILLMYFGRVGPLTMMISLTARNSRKLSGIHYPEEQLIVG